MTPRSSGQGACPPAADGGFRELAQLLGSRWTLLILRYAFAGVTTYSGFCAALGIPRDVLATRLATLVDAGLLESGTYTLPGSRPRADYHLTPDGQQLAPVIVGLAQWAADRGRGDLDPTIPVSARSARSVRAVVVDDDGAPVDACDVRICPGPSGGGGAGADERRDVALAPLA